MKNTIMLLSAVIGCSHLGSSFPSESDAQNNPLTYTFASGAQLTLPQGVSYSQIDHGAQFYIEQEPISIHVLEHQMDLIDSLQCTKKALYPEINSDSIQTLTPSDVSWDGIHIETYGPDPKDEYLQFIAKQKGNMVWVAAVKGSQAIFEKRNAQIMALLGSLTPKGHTKLDLSAIEAKSIKGREQQLAEFIEEVMRKARIPGLSIALLEEGQIAYRKGFGIRNIANTDPVNPDTRFMIGSTSKSLTTFLIAKLVEQGALHWENRVKDLYPEFTLNDQALADKVTLLDLACACTGIPRKDVPMILNHKGKKAEDLLKELQFLSPTTEYRETFQYNNQLVAAAGFIAAQAIKPGEPIDQSFAQLMHAKVFAPLKMHRTTAHYDSALKDSNHALSHSVDFSGNMELFAQQWERFAEYVSPSGGVWSTANDMAHYALAELNNGMLHGQQVLGEKELLKRRQKQVAINNELHYGLGWMVGKNTGLSVIHHGGSTLGSTSEFVLFPEKNRGIVILTNSSYGNLVQGPIVNKVLSLWFEQDLKAQELLQTNLKTYQEWVEHLQKQTFELNAEFMTPYLGSHTHPEIGVIEVVKQADAFFLKVQGQAFALKGHTSRNGEQKPIIAQAPLLGWTLDPVFQNGVSVRFERGQEAYDFRLL